MICETGDTPTPALLAGAKEHTPAANIKLVRWYPAYAVAAPYALPHIAWIIVNI